MTNEEAIEALTSKEVVNPYLTLEALEIAIEALKEKARIEAQKKFEFEMTPEEAIAILDTIPTIGEQVDALEMAIEALQNQAIAYIKVDFSEEEVKEIVENLKHETVIRIPKEYIQDAVETPEFHKGELIVYQNGDTFEIGEIKHLCKDGAFVYYHEGATASKTPFENMHKLRNAYCIKQTSFAQDRPRCGKCKYFCICSNSAGFTAAKSSDDASECDKYTEEGENEQ